jgi:Ser/Thr protein kinase RdoA (MazF antagonist)
MPRQLHRDVGLLGHWRRGFAAFVEDFIAGQPVEPDVPPAVLEKLGEAYGRTHAVLRLRPGRPHRPERADVIAQRLEWARKVAAEAAAQAPHLGASIAAQIQALERLRPHPPAAHSLCHNRVTRSNVIIRADGSVLLIDLERVKFGSNLHELALLAGEVLPDSEPALTSFLAGYARTAPGSIVPSAAPAAWAWHRQAVGLKRIRDALLAGDAARAQALLNQAAS